MEEAEPIPRIVPLQERAASLTGRLCSAIAVNWARGVPVTGKAASLCTPVAQFPARGVNEDNWELRARRAQGSRNRPETGNRSEPVEFKFEFKLPCSTGSDRYTGRLGRYTGRFGRYTGRFGW